MTLLLFFSVFIKPGQQDFIQRSEMPRTKWKYRVMNLPSARLPCLSRSLSPEVSRERRCASVWCNFMLLSPQHICDS